MNVKNNSNVTSARLMSLDVLRGFDMFWIIGGDFLFKELTKETGSGFLYKLLPQFKHVRWEGFHAWDLIMPLFLFIVGAAMPFSFNKRLEGGDSKGQLYSHIIKRVVILWIFGMVAQGNLLTYDLSKLHIYCNTLQAIAAGYLIASIAVYTAVHVFDFKHIGNIFAGGLGKWLGDWNDFVQGLAAFAVIWLIMYWMYRKKLFVKI